MTEDRTRKFDHLTEDQFFALVEQTFTDKWVSSILIKEEHAKVRKPHDQLIRKMHLFTETNEYVFDIKGYIPQNDYRPGESISYLGCIAVSRKERAGENWKRGNDLPDGPCTEKTWSEILQAIVKYELVKIHKLQETATQVAEPIHSRAEEERISMRLQKNLPNLSKKKNQPAEINFNDPAMPSENVFEPTPTVDTLLEVAKRLLKHLNVLPGSVNVATWHKDGVKKLMVMIQDDRFGHLMTCGITGFEGYDVEYRRVGPATAQTNTELDKFK